MGNVDVRDVFGLFFQVHIGCLLVIELHSGNTSGVLCVRGHIAGSGAMVSNENISR